MSKYAEDLRTIVGVNEIKKRLEELEEKAAINSSRGVGFQSGSDGSTQSASGPGGSGGIQAPSSAYGSGTAAISSAATDAAIAALEGMSNANGSQGMSHEADDGLYDLGDIIDNFADSELQGGGDSLASFNPNLSGIDGWTDCEDETDGTIRFDSYIPPLNWSDVNSPGELDGWVLGTRWAVSGSPSGTIHGSTADTAGENAAIDLNGSPPVPGDVPYVYVNTDGVGAGSVAHFTRTLNGPFTLPNIAVSCTAGVDSECPLTAPQESQWPTTGSFQLVSINGLFQGNQYDSEVPDKYAQPSSTVYMCFDSGSRTAVLTAGAGDTKLLYETDADGTPLAGSVLHIYDGRGQLKGYADVSALGQYTP